MAGFPMTILGRGIPLNRGYALDDVVRELLHVLVVYHDGTAPSNDGYVQSIS
jgi:hypothetical protein